MWINGYVNDNQIQAESDKAFLLKCAGSDWLVWIPKKCVKSGSHCSNNKVGLIADKEYELFKQGQGKYNRFEKTATLQVDGSNLAGQLYVG